MEDRELIRRYNYDSFVRENFEPWLRFDESPPLGEAAPDFPLRSAEDESEKGLLAICSENKYTVMEFGSFT